MFIRNPWKYWSLFPWNFAPFWSYRGEKVNYRSLEIKQCFNWTMLNPLMLNNALLARWIKNSSWLISSAIIPSKWESQGKRGYRFKCSFPLPCGQDQVVLRNRDVHHGGKIGISVFPVIHIPNTILVIESRVGFLGGGIPILVSSIIPNEESFHGWLEGLFLSKWHHNCSAAAVAYPLNNLNVSS